MDRLNFIKKCKMYWLAKHWKGSFTVESDFSVPYTTMNLYLYKKKDIHNLIISLSVLKKLCGVFRWDQSTHGV